MTRKEKLIQEYLAEPIKVGDTVHVKGLGSQDKNYIGNTCEVLEIKAGEIYYSVFLNVNFTGKPMSQEHIEFVKSIKII